MDCNKILATLGGVWFGCFLFSFSLEIENGDENVFSALCGDPEERLW